MEAPASSPWTMASSRTNCTGKLLQAVQCPKSQWQVWNGDPTKLVLNLWICSSLSRPMAPSSIGMLDQASVCTRGKTTQKTNYTHAISTKTDQLLLWLEEIWKWDSMMRRRSHLLRPCTDLNSFLAIQTGYSVSNLTLGIRIFFTLEVGTTLCASMILGKMVLLTRCMELISAEKL